MGEMIKVNFNNYKIEKIKKMEQDMKDKYGYYVHYVIPEKEGELIDCHTHGLMETFGHKEIQIKTTVSQKSACSFINSIVDIIRGLEIEKSILDLDVEIAPKGFVPIKYKELKDEFGEELIRLIIPDRNGKYPWDEDCEESYKKQWTMEDELNAKN